MSMDQLLETLESLEQRVERLVSTVRSLETERNDLRRKLDQALDEKNQAIEDKELIEKNRSSDDGARDEIRHRIQQLIDKIEHMEA